MLVAPNSHPSEEPLGLSVASLAGELYELSVQYYRSRNIVKAFGEDCIPLVCPKACPEAFATIYLPPMISTIQHSFEPIQWCGAPLHDMPKKSQLPVCRGS